MEVTEVISSDDFIEYRGEWTDCKQPFQLPFKGSILMIGDEIKCAICGFKSKRIGAEPMNINHECANEPKE